MMTEYQTGLSLQPEVVTLPEWCLQDRVTDITDVTLVDEDLGDVQGQAGDVADEEDDHWKILSLDTEGISRFF